MDNDGDNQKSHFSFKKIKEKEAKRRRRKRKEKLTNVSAQQTEDVQVILLYFTFADNLVIYQFRNS